MDLSVWLTYFLAAIVLSVTPGPGVFSSIRSGLHHGVRLGAWNAVGMQVANSIHVFVVAVGLGALLLASETLFNTLKWLGVAYLVYLGIATWRSSPGLRRRAGRRHDRCARSSCTASSVNLTNPKGIIFFVAIPAAVHRRRAPGGVRSTPCSPSPPSPWTSSSWSATPRSPRACCA
jgi:homoserine/homoserine lactone efflux protein